MLVPTFLSDKAKNLRARYNAPLVGSSSPTTIVCSYDSTRDYQYTLLCPWYDLSLMRIQISAITLAESRGGSLDS